MVMSLIENVFQIQIQRAILGLTLCYKIHNQSHTPKKEQKRDEYVRSYKYEDLMRL